jgi:hypothetical protein
MKRRLFMAVGMSALLMATLMPGVATAAEPERFGRIDSTRHRVDPDLARRRSPPTSRPSGR